MATSPSYDRERAKRYKKWWARQKGQPQGELIEVSTDTWQQRTARAELDDREPRVAEGGKEGK